MPAQLNFIQETFDATAREIKKVIQGQDEVIKHLLIALFAGGHVLLEGVPGLGKTLLVNALANVTGGTFKRIQFTPDLMPSDIIGTSVYNAETSSFQIKKGPIFTNLLLADEVNRSPAKTQSALLQAMQEKAVNIDGTDHHLGDFFLCLATQNPIEMEGTYPLPEAQVDRFLLKLFIHYPSFEEEKNILAAYTQGFSADNLENITLNKTLDETILARIRGALNEIVVDEKILSYITTLVHTTRSFNGIEFGSSPRGSVALLQTARVQAVLSGRDFVIPDDVKDMVYPALRHRIILEAEAEIEGATPDDFLAQIIEQTAVPQ